MNYLIQIVRDIHKSSPSYLGSCVGCINNQAVRKVEVGDVQYPLCERCEAKVA